MKVWRTIAQNVLSGCVGGLLVMSSAQAQKSASVAIPYEIKAHRLVIFDEHNKKCAELDGTSGLTSLALTSGKSLVHLSVSDQPSLFLSSEGKGSVRVGANGSESGLTAVSNNGNYMASLNATDSNAEFSLYKNKSGQLFNAKVDDERSSVIAFGPQSGFSVGDEKSRTRGSLDWGIDSSCARLDLRDKTGREFWSQPPMFGGNK
jgi:hypothetical protein